MEITSHRSGRVLRQVFIVHLGKCGAVCDSAETDGGECMATGIDDRVQALLATLTLDEKISLLSGKDFWTLPAIERCGIPSLRVSDGPTGLRSTNSDPATVFPVGVALAATWNTPLIESVGGAIGREAIAYDVDVLLAPGVNIQRTPLGGRNFEYYSEDPHLSAQIGSAYVNGVQAEGVGTSVKHYVANNQEHERMRASSNVSERALREIYLASFEPIIREAKPWTVMSSYNRVNGTFASEHNRLLNHILKNEWGFDGVVVSDWGAVKSTAASARGGLDLEMPGPARFYGAALKAAVEAGEVTEAAIDDHAGRVLLLIVRCGLLDDNPKRAHAELMTPSHRRIARNVAAESIVLLKNENDFLPLKGAPSIAVIGGLADYPAIQGGGSSQVSPDRILSPFEGLQEALGARANIRFERGIEHEPRPPIIDGRLLTTGDGTNAQGLKVRYYKTSDFSGAPVGGNVDWRFAKLGFGEIAQQEDNLGFSVEWTGMITPRFTGRHELRVTHSNPDVTVMIDDEIIIGPNTSRKTEILFMILPLHRRDAVLDFKAGEARRISIRYSQPAENAIRAFNIFNVYLREPAPERAAAIAAAQQSDCAIVFVGSGTTSETEGEDRASMRLSDEMNQLVEDVVSVNPNTIVVSNTGGPVEMPWVDQVPAILQTWLAGQEGGGALADVLTGQVSPSGKLPVTFPKCYADNPTYPYYPGGLQTDYGEGVLVGYRYYDKVGIDPLFAFGHGLSYSAFELSDVDCDGTLKIGDTFTFSVTIQNVGDVAAAETVQVYIEDNATAETMAPRQLRAFQKVMLQPGERQTLKFKLNPRAFAWFSPDASDWETTPGRYRLHVGTSSRNLPLCARLELMT